MNKLTFPGFLKRYVASLSATNSTAIVPLAREAATTNARLREPLFLYAMATNRTHVLMSAAKDTPMYNEYLQLSNQYNFPALMAALADQSPALPVNYLKVWRSYKSATGSYDRDLRVKGLIRGKVITTKQAKKLSTYRICKDLSLNAANVNAWLKNGDNRVSLNVARSVLEYTENY